jgi:hypothetical protein
MELIRPRSTPKVAGRFTAYIKKPPSNREVFFFIPDYFFPTANSEAAPHQRVASVCV